MSGKVFYESLFCIVTDTKVLANGKVYSINAVNNVTCNTKSHLRFAPCVALVLVMALVDNYAFYALLVGLVILAWFITSNGRHFVNIETSNGVVEIVSSNNKAKVLQISNALNKAIASR